MNEINKGNGVSEGGYESKDIKSSLLGGMRVTQSWLTLENLKAILPLEQYQELESTVRNGVKQFYSRFDSTGFTQEEMEEVIAEKMRDTMFGIEVDENDNFILQEQTFSRDKITRKINVSELNDAEFASEVEKAMQKHLNYGEFHTNEYLKEEEIPQTLEHYINLVKEYQQRKEKEELHKSNFTDEVSTKRLAEETEIADSLSMKEKLTSEIGSIEQELEELGEKETDLKKKDSNVKY